MTINQRIKELLGMKKFSDKYIAEQCDLSDNTIRSYKNGNSKPNFKFLFWLFSEFADLSIQWLFYEKGEMFLEVDNNGDEDLRNQVKALATNQKRILDFIKELKLLLPELKIDLEDLEHSVEESEKVIRASIKE